MHSSSLPLLAIEPLPESAEQRAMILELDRYCAVVVVSKPAARLGLELLDRYWLQPRSVRPGSASVAPPGRSSKPTGWTSAGPSGVTTVKRCWRCHDWRRRWPGRSKGIDHARRGRPRVPRRDASRAWRAGRLSSYTAAACPTIRLNAGAGRSVGTAQRPGGQQWAGSAVAA